MLELAQEGTTVEGHCRLDPRDDGVKLVQYVAAAVADFGRVYIELHVRMLDIEENHFVTARGTCLHQSPVAVQVGVGSEHPDAQSRLLTVKSLEGCFQFSFRDFTLNTFFRYIDQKVIHERLPSQKHSVLHGVAVGQRQFDVQRVLSNLYSRLNDVAFFGNARSVLDHLSACHTFFARDDNASVVLDGGDFKFDPFLPVFDEGLDFVGLNG